MVFPTHLSGRRRAVLSARIAPGNARDRGAIPAGGSATGIEISLFIRSVT